MHSHDELIRSLRVTFKIVEAVFITLLCSGQPLSLLIGVKVIIVTLQELSLIIREAHFLCRRPNRENLYGSVCSVGVSKNAF